MGINYIKPKYKLEIYGNFVGSTNFLRPIVQEISNLGFLPFLNFVAQKGHFLWSNGYTIYQTLIES